MRAIVVKPGLKDSIHMRDMPDPRMGAEEVAVRVLRVGLCGTDFEINDGRFGAPPEGDEFLILGHENIGIVEDVGRRVKGVKPGDVVVSTVRRPCGECYYCAHGQNDMCTSGRYQERGIIKRHGFMAELYVEAPRWLIRIPKALRDTAILLEPLSVVEKGVDQAFRLQERLPWRPKTALVLGAGPIGLLAAAVLRLRGLATYVAGREAATDRRARIVSTLGATYCSVDGKTLRDVQKELPPVDLAVEATGVAAVAFDAMQILGGNGVLCLLSLTGGAGKGEEPIDAINRQLVLGNQVVFGSVNASPQHFKMGVKDLGTIEKKWPGVAAELLTTQLPWGEYKDGFGRRGDGIKTTLEISGR